MSDLDQLARLARLDDLTQRTMRWADREVAWRPLARAKSVVSRTIPRIEAARVRLEAPLVVATFGGTGTGKSSLVNALVGREVARAGRQRPTTTVPTLVVHPETDLSQLTLPPDEVTRVEAESELLRHVVILDCPDPDTSDDAAVGSERDEAASNLAILRRMLPHCDVLLVVSTQQKYRTARVVDELGQAAAGCRLVFVQTHADRDEDIRDDWAEVLRSRGYDAPDLFFVDSPAALAGRPGDEMRRLLDLLEAELTGSQKARIRHANVADLLAATLDAADRETAPETDRLDELESRLAAVDAAIRDDMAAALKAELIGSTGLWERRMVASVTDQWGGSPFAALLRVWNGLGGWIASLALFRARGAAQMALIGAVQGVRTLRQRREEEAGDSLERRPGLLGLSDDRLRTERAILDGAVSDAGFDADALADKAPARTGDFEASFLQAATRQIDRVVDELVQRNARLPIRLLYEILFSAFILFVLVRAGKNFFYDSFLGDDDLLGTEFWVTTGLFFLAWSYLLATLYVRRLRRGLDRRVREMTDQLATAKLGATLFPSLRDAVQRTRRDLDELRALRRDADAIERDSSRLGQRRG